MGYLLLVSNGPARFFHPSSYISAFYMGQRWLVNIKKMSRREEQIEGGEDGTRAWVFLLRTL